MAGARPAILVVPKIDPNRLLADLRALSSFGRYKTGVHRPTYSADDMTARRWLAKRIEDSGLRAEIDGIGNVYGFNQTKSHLVLAGSHLESQNYAGWLDGALGVIFALEAARAISASGSHSDAGVDVVAFADEEGHFGSYLGSRSFVGDLTDVEIDSAVEGMSGRKLRESLAAAGLADFSRRVIETSRYRAFLEAHIEQGDILESTGMKIGVVTEIVAIWQYRIVASGEQNHAGTTTMARRRDAGLAMIKLLTDIDGRFPEVAGPLSVWTTGKIVFSPGAKSIIPGRAEALFQFRDTNADVLTRFANELDDLVKKANKVGPCTLTLERISASRPVPMDGTLQNALEHAAARHTPGLHIRMPSGAGHDAQWLAPKLPTGMLFVPSIGGISHHWAENTSDEDIVLGAQIFTDAIMNILEHWSPLVSG